MFRQPKATGIERFVVRKPGPEGRGAKLMAALCAANPSTTILDDNVETLLTMPVSPPPAQTRSQALFSALTKIDSRSLKISNASDNIEFGLFMDLRTEQKWASYQMNPTKWVQATCLFNERLAEKNGKHGFKTINKHPRALMDKLDWVEREILGRITRGDFVGELLLCTMYVFDTHARRLDSAKSSGTTTFWTKHCDAVYLGRDMDAAKAKNVVSVVFA